MRAIHSGHKTGSWLLTATAVTGLAVLPAAAPARAQDDFPAATQDELSVAEDYGSTYARLRHIEGSVSLRRVHQGEIVEEAELNAPLAPGDLIEVYGGRAEIALADGSTLWLEEGSRLELRTLADLDNRYERTNLLVLDEGILRLEASEAGGEGPQYRVDSPGGSARLLSGGSVRIDADGSVTTVSSFRGVAEVIGDAGSVIVRSGERSSVAPGRVPSSPRPFNTARPDDFDRFCQERLEAYLAPAPDDDAGEGGDVVEELPPEVRPYYPELSVYGSWHYLSPYGWVWHPTYAGSWGPYWRGAWTWYPTGWIWVSYDPWGWAPYRYGRWDFVGSVGWIWIPGRVWRGAWVGFAVGRSYLGWCPLNYYNRPVFHDVTIVNVVNVRAGRLDPRGWRFAHVGRFSERRLQTVRADRLPRDSEFVLSGRLPRFDPRDVSGRPDGGRFLQEKVRRERVALPGGAAAGRDVPFRSLEPRGRRGEERGRPSPSGRRTIATPHVGPKPSPAAPRRPDAGVGAPRRIGSVVTRPEGRPGLAPRPGTRPRPGVQSRPGVRSQPGVPARPGVQARPGAPNRPSAAPHAAPHPGRPQGAARPQDGGPRRVAPPPRNGEARPGHVVERLFERARGERARPPEGGARGRVRPPGQAPRARPQAQSRPPDRGRQASPPPRPPRQDNKDKDR